jgi:hypothetical protein
LLIDSFSIFLPFQSSMWFLPLLAHFLWKTSKRGFVESLKFISH